MDRLLAWAFIIIVIENQRKWRKSTKNRQKKLCIHCVLQHTPIKQNPKPDFITHGATSAFNLLLYAHQSSSTLTRVFSRQLHFSPIAPAFLRENAHALRKFFIHHGKIMHTLEHSLWLSEVSPTLGHTLSMVVSWTISTYCFRTLRFLIFSHFPSFCPAVAFRLVFPTMTHGCSTDVDHPASPRATRAPSLGFCCFCYHYSSPPYGSFSHHWYRRTGASFLCHWKFVGPPLHCYNFCRHFPSFRYRFSAVAIVITEPLFPELNSSARLVNTAHWPRRILQQEISHKVLFAHILFWATITDNQQIRFHSLK